MNNYVGTIKTTRDNLGERYPWIDVLKFLGIFAIYLGHCIDTESNIYYFLFEYHVPLFFFASGLFASKDLSMDLKAYVGKKARQLLVPYGCFSILALMVFTLLESMGPRRVLQVIINFIFAKRNTLVAGSLWFIPCIFIVSVLYIILNKAIKGRKGILLVIGGLFILSQTLLVGRGPGIFNIYSAMYYIVFYALGDFCFKILRDFKFNTLDGREKTIFIILSAFALILTAITWFWGSGAVVQLLVSKIPLLGYIPLFKSLYLFMASCVIIYVNILLAYGLREVKLFQLLGRNTLSLCGTENIVRESFNTLLIMFGFNLRLMNPLASVIYTFITLLISNSICERIFKPYFSFILGKGTGISIKNIERKQEDINILAAG